MALVNTTSPLAGLFDQIASDQRQLGIGRTIAPYIGNGQQLPQNPGILSQLLGLSPAQQSQQTADAGAPQASSLPSMAAQQGAPTGAGLGNLFASATSRYGLPQGYLPRLAAIESKFDPNAVSSTGAAGPYQFTKGTAAQYGLTNPTDWASSTDAAARLTVANRSSLASALGRDPTPGELYLAHQQGAAGAAKLLANPSARAGDVVGDQAVRVNGGDPNMPAGAFAQMWTSKFGGGAPTQVAGGNVTPPPWYHPTRQPDPRPGAVASAASAAAASDDDDAGTAAAAPQAPAVPQTPVGVTPEGSTPATMASRGGAVTPDLLRALLNNPDTVQAGLQLWQQSLTGKSFNFLQTPDGSIVRVDPQSGTVAAVYHGPSKGVVVNKSLVDPTTGRVIYGGEKDDPSYDYQTINGHLIAANKGNANDVKDVTPGGLPAGYRPATLEERQAYGAASNIPLMIGPDGKPSTLNGGVTVNLGDKANGGLDNKIVEDIDEGRKNAVAAAGTLQNINHMGDLLDSGQLITGAGANQRASLRNALATVLGIDDPGVTKTQEFLSAANSKAATIARSISGAGHTTNADLDMAKVISGADPTYSSGALRQILQWQQQNALQQVQRHNADVDNFSKIQPDAAQRAGFFRVEPPQLYDLSKGQAPAAGPVRVGSPAEYNRLPSGAQFIDPEGTLRTKR